MIANSLWPLTEALVKGPLTHFYFFAGDSARVGIFNHDLQQSFHLITRLFQQHQPSSACMSSYDIEGQLYNRVELQYAQKAVVLTEVPVSRFHPQDWDPKTAFIFFPGGEATLLQKQIGHQLDALRYFWTRGGRIWAQCGSAYWLSHHRTFTFAADQVRTTENPKALFPGRSIGPLSLSTSQPYKCAAAIISMAHTSFSAPTFLAGGGSFTLSKGDEFEPLAYYDDPTFSKEIAAVIGRDPSGGAVVLIHPHINYSGDEIIPEAFDQNFPKQGNWRKIKDKLQSSETQRMIMLAQIIGYMCGDGLPHNR
jgi:glutamine amidotransferase-like uncharacterized protein